MNHRLYQVYLAAQCTTHCKAWSSCVSPRYLCDLCTYNDSARCLVDEVYDHYKEARRKQ